MEAIFDDMNKRERLEFLSFMKDRYIKSSQRIIKLINWSKEQGLEKIQQVIW